MTTVAQTTVDWGGERGGGGGRLGTWQNGPFEISFDVENSPAPVSI